MALRIAAHWKSRDIAAVAVAYDPPEGQEWTEPELDVDPGPLGSIFEAGHVGLEMAVAEVNAEAGAELGAEFVAETEAEAEAVDTLASGDFAEPAAARLPELAAEAGPEAGSEAEAFVEPVAELGIARLSDVAAELEAETHTAVYVAAIVSALAVVVRRGNADAIGNEIESDPCPGNIAQSFALVVSSARRALGVIATGGIERRLHGQPGSSAPHPRTRDVVSAAELDQNRYPCGFLAPVPLLASPGRNSVASHYRFPHRTYRTCGLSLRLSSPAQVGGLRHE